MEFNSMLNPHAREESQDTGFKETLDTYEDVINEKTGVLETKKTGEVNFYEKIQANKESYELENIIKRYSIDINKKSLTEVSEDIVDLTRVPTDLIDAYAMVNRLENLYADTTAEFKNHFGDFASFLRSVQNGTIASDLQEISLKTAVKNKDIEKMKAESLKIEAERKALVDARIAEAKAKDDGTIPNYNEILGGENGR